jgi:hypothetical protein
MSVVADLWSVSKTSAVFVTPHFLLKHGCIGEWRMSIKPTSTNVSFSTVFFYMHVSYECHQCISVPALLNNPWHA